MAARGFETLSGRDAIRRRDQLANVGGVVCVATVQWARCNGREALGEGCRARAGGWGVGRGASHRVAHACRSCGGRKSAAPSNEESSGVPRDKPQAFSKAAITLGAVRAAHMKSDCAWPKDAGSGGVELKGVCIGIGAAGGR